MAVHEKAGMSTVVAAETLIRVLEEGHGPREAWYGANMRQALDGVDAAQACRRPAPDCHNIAEIALHHAYWAREVRKRLTGIAPGPFVLDGEDWFTLDDGSRLGWDRVRAEVETATRQLAETVEAVAAGRQTSPLDEAARFDLVLGIAGHAAYHAGQVQLVRKLTAR